MKVFQVLNHFLPQQTAGTEIYVWALSKKLMTHGLDVQIIIPNYEQEKNDTYVYDGIKVFKYAENSVVDRALIMGKKFADGLIEFQKYLLKENPDIVHFHELAGSNGITLQHVIVAKKAGFKTIMTFHLSKYSCQTGTLLYLNEKLCDGKIDIKKCSKCYLHNKGTSSARGLLLTLSSFFNKCKFDTTNWNSKIGTALGTSFLIEKLNNDLKQIVSNTDKVVVLTTWYKKILLLNGVHESNISIIEQGLPLPAVTKVVSSNNEKVQKIRLIFLGRIDPLKGLHILIDALINLPEDQIELDIYGQVVDNNYKINLQIKTEFKKNIHWKGLLLQKDVIETIKQHDALCLCSTIAEMSPLVIQESFAAGIPVIASSVYGNLEQIRDGVNGLLFGFNDVDSLTEVILRCINNPDLLPSLKQAIKEPRNFDQVGKEYLDIYNNLI